MTSIFKRRPPDPSNNKLRGAVVQPFGVASAVSPRGAARAAEYDASQGGGAGETEPFEIIGQRPEIRYPSGVPAGEVPDLDEALKRHLLGQIFIQGRQQQPAYRQSQNADKFSVDKQNILADTLENISRAGAQAASVPGHMPQSTLKFDRHEYKPPPGDQPAGLDEHGLGYLGEIQKAKNMVGMEMYKQSQENQRHSDTLSHQTTEGDKNRKIKEQIFHTPPPELAHDAARTKGSINALIQYMRSYSDFASSKLSMGLSQIPMADVYKFTAANKPLASQIIEGSTGQSPTSRELDQFLVKENTMPDALWTNSQAEMSFRQSYQAILQRLQNTIIQGKSNNKDVSYFENLKAQAERDFANELRKFEINSGLNKQAPHGKQGPSNGIYVIDPHGKRIPVLQGTRDDVTRELQKPEMRGWRMEE